MPESALFPYHPVPVLQTARLLLRGYRPDDLPVFLAMFQNPDFYRYLTGRPLMEEEAWTTLLRSAGHWVLQGFGFWAVEEKATGHFIGSVGFVDRKRSISPPINGAPEIGWVLDPATHGRGYATEAVQAALAWGDAHFRGARTVCIMDPDNQASRRIAAKFGYHEYARTIYHDQPTLMLERPAQS
ncbi:GCN5-related N-acetyltransferase [Hymenobacter roseosalivarius DSM 11622]|uniref:GCN5-related N-acetyltransferase n=1 Tax=Hymenobacter roseosalivarius DSM 11622 TaxID=645990 RepID=A0A1W1VXK2_9BACT|nr:GNAT family N-acetyltransferase [Hymenobacter roseosalivarius]SMB98066.1 GCN5-related N-acetyltransferase [Hymenobacter roseosalivarius DSM 11622]